MFFVMVLRSEVGILGYIFSISNEQSFIFSSILVLERDCVKLYEFGMLNVLGNVIVLFNAYVSLSKYSSLTTNLTYAF
jgi:hypothetical protein